MSSRQRALLLAALFSLSLVAGCFTPKLPDGGGNGPGPLPGGAPPVDVTLAFDGERAFDFVRAQVRHENGTTRYRVPGTPGNAEAAAFIAGEMRGLGWEVGYHHFNATYGCDETPMHNLVATLPGKSEATFYLGAHYDTRPIADKEEREEDRAKPIEGANDGGSGVGVLLELARALGAGPWNATYVFLFFDGEDGGGYGGTGCTDWLLGSTAYAGDLSEEKVARAEGFILLDMVGHPELRLPREGFSRSPPPYFPEGAEASPRLLDELWSIAGGLGYPQFVNDSGIFVHDDHIPFLRRGIPSVDVIHLRDGADAFSPTHHRLSDTLENVSAESLEAVGRVVEYHVKTWDARLGPRTETNI